MAGVSGPIIVNEGAEEPKSGEAVPNPGLCGAPAYLAGYKGNTVAPIPDAVNTSTSPWTVALLHWA